MIITSSTTASQVYATTKTTAAQATSAYESVAPTTAQQTDRMAQMEEKYKDVYTPMPTEYSEETENKITDTIREKYPNYLTFDERFKDYRIPYTSNVTEQDKEKLKELGAAWEENNKKYIESLGGQDAYDACMKYEGEVRQDNPVNFWDRKNMRVSNSKELTTFYNAAVYEGLEKGKSLQEAKVVAFHAVDNYMDTSDYYANTLGKIEQKYAAMGNTSTAPNWSREGAVDYGTNIDLREYGFDMRPLSKKVSQNQNVMADFAQKKLDYFNFIVDNQNIVDQQYNKLNSSYISGRNSYDEIVKPVIDEYLPQAQIAVDVFSKYKIFDSIDIKA